MEETVTSQDIIVANLEQEVKRYQQMTDEIWKWAVENRCVEVVEIIKEWCC